MKPPRLTYVVIGRTSTDLPVRLLIFRTALDLDRVRGLRRRLKTICGGPERLTIRRLPGGA